MVPFYVARGLRSSTPESTPIPCRRDGLSAAQRGLRKNSASFEVLKGHEFIRAAKTAQTARLEPLGDALSQSQTICATTLGAENRVKQERPKTVASDVVRAPGDR
jgi:hypothetical protein